MSEYQIKYKVSTGGFFSRDFTDVEIVEAPNGTRALELFGDKWKAECAKHGISTREYPAQVLEVSKL